MTTMPPKQKGFTIVELLIVIVVIGILAAITVVAYNGIQSRARTATYISDLNALGKHASLLNAENGHYPISDVEFKTLLINSGYWNNSRGSVPDSERRYIIVCANSSSDYGIILMAAPGMNISWSIGGLRMNWKASSGISTQYATSSLISMAATCSDIGLPSPIYGQWAHNLT